MDTASQEYALLLIEDDVVDQESFRRVFHKATQFSVSIAASLHDGIQLIRETAFDAVLFDLGLPDSYGIDTIKRMTEEFPSIPLIVFTGLSDMQTAQEAIRYGVRDYLVKGEASDARVLESVRKVVLSK